MKTDAVKSFFNERAEVWDTICTHDPEKINRLLDLCQITPGDRVLDVACGTGVLTPFLFERGAQVLGVDFAEQMIAQAKRKYTDVRFLAQDIFSVTEDGFDLVIIYSAFPHFADREALFSHLQKRLKPGGRIAICHSESRAEIDRRHHGAASEISRKLPSAEELKETLSKWFVAEHTIENDALYFVSGIKSQELIHQIK